MSYGIIYRATLLIDGRMYYGMTTKSLQKRIKGHANPPPKHTFYFQRSIKKYGIDAFKWEIVEICHCKEALITAERKWIAHDRTFERKRGFNLTRGGEGFELNQEARQRQKQSLRGRTFSEEHRKNISKTRPNKIPVYQFDQTGKLINSFTSQLEATFFIRKLTGKQNAEIRLKGRSYRRSHGFIWRNKPDFDTNQFEASIQRTQTAETRKKISQKALGRQHTDETKLLISETKKGRQLSDEHRKKLSRAASNFWKRKLKS